MRIRPAEERLVRELLTGATNRQIGERLGLREQTVKNQLSRIYRRVGVRNRLELALFAPAYLRNDAK